MLVDGEAATFNNVSVGFENMYSVGYRTTKLKYNWLIEEYVKIQERRIISTLSMLTRASQLLVTFSATATILCMIISLLSWIWRKELLFNSLTKVTAIVDRNSDVNM